MLDIQPKITDPAQVWDEYFNTLEGMISRRVGAKKSINAPLTSSAAPAAAQPAYSSADSVKADFKAGRISREQAMQALGGFGMK